ncbi:DUF2949 domain-containing protein [Lusitaniella coriacea LEGE 07157]|uniref:DUF2949 domain-containing protein n=1 Tax=Lusitaniella coriacea LEGE 07157 TaxID=945747 RepID=A0A8J7DZ50_9CYAN|nr:DUF2949 domain-containing protein [Lusitaniella coriacea]MBE9116744.1 DUF2949 domain-containing protein [Lusitaniella coriacea LEGE 07157]
MKTSILNQFINFLQEELALPSESIKTALRQCEENIGIGHLPMVLWQYGLVNLKQLDLIFEWLETA